MALGNTAGSRAARSRKAARGRVPPPRVWGLRGSDVIAAVAFNAVLIIGMWLRHGALDNLGGSAAKLTALGQLTALLGTYGALVQVVLMTRSPWLEQLFGLDHLAHFHRWLGFGVTIAIMAHVVLTTVGYALGDGSSIAAEWWKLLATFPFVLMATVGTGLLLMVAATSVRMARRRMTYETWHFIHFYAYLAIALSFGHVLAVGTDFSNDTVARAYWIGLYLAVLALVLAFRVGNPIRLTLHHHLRVARVVPEAPGVVSIYVTGRDLRNLRSRAGQFFIWRFLTPDRWWKGHPFSLSAAPNGEHLRFTVKDVGDDSAQVRNVLPGTRVAIEGPYGVFTTLRRRQGRVLLIAGGIGITPIRALLEEMPSGKGNVVLIYRARGWDEVVFRDELDDLIAERQGLLHYMVGHRASSDLPAQPFSAKALRALVPDLQRRDVFICGAGRMMRELHQALSELGVPNEQIHYERFALL